MNKNESESNQPQATDIRARPSRARYDKVKSGLDLKWRRRAPQFERMSREIVDALWDAFGTSPWTWCGLWILQPDGKAFQPGPARPEPAPGALPVEGRLGDALTASEPIRESGRIFIPALDKTGRAWAVFEGRSSTDFDEMDARWIERLLKIFHTLERALPPPLP
jgi:hypothetical protein